MHKPAINRRIAPTLCALASIVVFNLGAMAQSVERTTDDRLTILESDLRFQLEMTWRHKPRQWKARTAEVDQAFAAWQRSPQSGADRQKLESWLRQAIVNSLPGESGKLPPLPEFSAPPAVTKQLTLPPAKPTQKQPALPPAAAPTTTLPAPPASSTAKLAQQASRTAPQTHAPKAKASNPKPAAEQAAQPSAIAQRPTAASPMEQTKQPINPSTNQQARTDQPIRSTPRATIAAPGQPPREIRLRPLPQYKPRRATEHRLASRPPKDRPSPSASTPQPVAAAKPVETPATRPDASVVLPLSVPQLPSAPQQQDAVSSAQASTPPSDKLAVAGKTPVAEKPVVAVEPPPASAAAPTKPRIAPSLAQPRGINLAELNARISGYHDGLDEIEATIVAARGGLTRGQVTRLTGLLEQLAGQYQFVQLYYDGLTDRERLFVAQPRPMGATIKLVDSQRAALSSAEETDFLTALEVASENDELRRRLESLAQMAAETPARSPDNGE